MTIFLLIASLAALLCGPLLYLLARRNTAFLSFLDGFVLVSVTGLVLLEVLPGTLESAGLWSLAFLAAGLWGPSLVESTLERARREAHLATLVLAMLGLWLHSVADGAALASGGGADHAGHGHGDALAISIVIHSVPVGLMVWWLMAPVFGNRWPAVTLLLMCGGTLAGYMFAARVGETLGGSGFAWFQALVAGSILHVVFGRPHLEEAKAPSLQATKNLEGMGNVAALLALFVVAQLDPHASALSGAFGAVTTQLVLIGWPVLVGVLLLRALGDHQLFSRLSDLIVAGVVSMTLLGWPVTLVWICAVIFSEALLVARNPNQPEGSSNRAGDLKTIVDELAPWTVIAALFAGMLPAMMSVISVQEFAGWALLLSAALVVSSFRIHPLACVIIAGAMLGAALPSSGVLMILMLGPLPPLLARETELRVKILRVLILTGLAGICMLGSPYLGASLQGWSTVPHDEVWRWLTLFIIGLPCLWSLLRLGGRGWVARILPNQRRDHCHA